MVDRSLFNDLVADAYRELYDLVRLRTHPLADALGLDETQGHKQRAWQLHQILLEGIEELIPAPQTPAYSREWCRYRVMRLRYVDGLGPVEIARKMMVSRRQYYREHDSGIEALAELFWQRHVQSRLASSREPMLPNLQDAQAQLVRAEATRTAQAGGRAAIADEVRGAIAILQGMLGQRSLEAAVALPESPLTVAAHRSLLRQVIVGMLGYLCEHAQQARIEIAARGEGAEVRLTMAVEPAEALAESCVSEVEERLSAWNELAAVCSAQVRSLQVRGHLGGLESVWPRASSRTVLVVDDNEDLLALFQHYLSLHNYHAVTATTAQAALRLAREVQPQVISVDLMMPERDGWDVLQTLLNQPDTRDIPIIVCSVLRERDLALSLGAAAFLQKPVTEEALLAVLQALDAN